MSELLLRRRMAMMMGDKLIYGIYNHNCYGTVATLVDTGLDLVAIQRWRLELEVENWLDPPTTSQATIIDLKDDKSPSHGFCIRAGKKDTATGANYFTECGFDKTLVITSCTFPVQFTDPWGVKIQSQLSSTIQAIIERNDDQLNIKADGYECTATWFPTTVHGKTLCVGGASNNNTNPISYRRFVNCLIKKLEIYAI